MSTRMSRNLEDRVQSSDEADVVEVIVELRRDDSVTHRVAASGISRVEMIDALKTRFDEISSVLEEEIQNVGGTVVDRAWINQTLRARLPVKGISQLADRDDVTLIDVPHKIEPESA